MTQEQRIAYLVTLLRIAVVEGYDLQHSINIFAVVCHKTKDWRTKQYYADANARDVEDHDDE